MKRGEWGLIAIVSFMIFSYSFVSLNSPTGMQTFEPQIIINSCPIAITSNSAVGSNLTSNGTCITINASNIILDCSGYEITGNTTGYGITSTNFTNITIKNCIITNFSTGIYADTINNSFYINNTARKGNYGFELFNSSNNELTNNTANNNAFNGFDIQFGGNNTLTNNTARLNNHGIFISFSDASTLLNNTARDNGGAGFFISSSLAVTANYNTGVNDTSGGFAFITTPNCSLNGNQAYNNTAATGITLNTNSDNCNLTNNQAYNNQIHGIIVIASTGARIDNNTARNNTNNGISLGGSQHTVINNYAYNNSEGILANPTNNSVFTNNTAYSNVINGIRIAVNSFNNTLTNNTAYLNGQQGIHLSVNVSNNTLTNNTAYNNTRNGIILENGCQNNILNNNTASNNTLNGITMKDNSNNNNLSQSTIEGNSQFGLAFTSSHNNKITDTTIRDNTNASINFASSTNNTLNNTIIRTSTTWLATDGTSTGNNITNTSFLNYNGTIRFEQNITVPSGIQADTSNLNISYNKAFLNSIILAFLNQTAEITLKGLTAPSVQAIVDFEDDGTYIVCLQPQCVPISYTAGTFIFNASSFTTYSTTIGNVTLTLTKTDSPDPVTPGGTLTYTITYNITNGTSFNTTINETYPAQVTFASSTPVPSSGNNGWDAGNLTIGQSYQINITVTVNPGTSGLITNEVNVSLSNSTGGNFNLTIQENTTVVAPTPSGRGGGSGGRNFYKVTLPPSVNCSEQWICAEWTECFNQIQTRECTDQNNCNTTIYKPATSKPCQQSQIKETEQKTAPKRESPAVKEPVTPEPKKAPEQSTPIPATPQLPYLTLALIALAVIAAITLILKRKSFTRTSWKASPTIETKIPSVEAILPEVDKDLDALLKRVKAMKGSSQLKHSKKR
ncbi:Right handed beta helix region [uncultured archaeon]|nr:Right handed beta helix region [uncultured archaeon]